jgi:hypothetical protein
MRKRLPWFILLLGGALGLLSCIPWPEQPGDTQPYALIVLPEAIRLVALDNQTIDARARIKDIRVSPGLHRLRFVYAGRSTAHAGQSNDPLCLETQAGLQYIFGTVTRGIIWRPVIETQALIPGYCTTHRCTQVETQVPLQPPRTPPCSQTSRASLSSLLLHHDVSLALPGQTPRHPPSVR